jgi:hypothetical protein
MSDDPRLSDKIVVEQLRYGFKEKKECCLAVRTGIPS